MKNLIIITGANGVLGSKLLNNLEGKQYPVLGILRDGTKINENNNYKLCEVGNLNNRLQDYRLEGAICIHTAFSRSSESANLLESIHFGCDLLEFLADKGVKNFINISSQSIYDPTRLAPAKERDLPRPRTNYGIYKVFFETWLSEFVAQRKLNGNSVRLGGLIGIEFPTRFVNRWLREALTIGKITITPSDSMVSFISVNDAVEGLELLSQIPPSSWPPKINIGSTKIYTVERIALLIKQIVEDKLGLIIDIERQGVGVFSNNTVNTNLMKEVTNWHPQETLGLVIEELLHCELQ